MSLIMGLIRPELSELFALEFANIAESDFVYPQASVNTRPVSTKHGHNIYDNEILVSLIMGQIRQKHRDLFALE